MAALFVLAATVTVSAVPQPVPVTVTFGKTITSPVGTITVAGTIVIDAANRSANGTIRVSVANATGAVIQAVSIQFWNNGTVIGPFAQDVALAAAGVVVHVTVDPPSGPAYIAYTLIVSGPQRRP